MVERIGWWKPYWWLPLVEIWTAFPYLPFGYVKIAIENGHRNTEFSHEKWVDLSIVM